MQSFLSPIKVLWSCHPAAQTRRAARCGHGRRAGFTLIELMVVLAIAVIVTSITVNGFKELTDGNRRTTCQTNLHQVYQGLRLYMNDEAGGVPLYYHYTDGTEANREPNIGLWALYTYQDMDPLRALPPRTNNRGERIDHRGSINRKDLPIAAVGTKPIGRYIRSAKVLHCPADEDEADLHTNLYLDPETKKQFNPLYLSYQPSDNGTVDPVTDGANGSLDMETYMPSRILKPSSSTPADWKRQLNLMESTGSTNPPVKVSGTQPQDDTIVTWCRWHQFNRGFDNVLFFDGSVQYIQHVQPNPAPSPAPATLDNWHRVPKPILP